MRAMPLPGRHLPGTTAPAGFRLAGNTTGGAAQLLLMGISDLEVGMGEFGWQGRRGDRLCSWSTPSHRAGKQHLHRWLVQVVRKLCFQTLAFLPLEINQY